MMTGRLYDGETLDEIWPRQLGFFNKTANKSILGEIIWECYRTVGHAETVRVLDRLKELRVNHRDLDYLIDSLSHDPMVDQLRIRRLKKRRLILKDMISALESELIPDMDA